MSFQRGTHKAPRRKEKIIMFKKSLQDQFDLVEKLTKSSFSKDIKVECKHCQGTGICYEPNGEDDVNAEICNCENNHGK